MTKLVKDIPVKLKANSIQEVVDKQQSLKDLVEGELRTLMAEFPEKSKDPKFRNLVEASKSIQLAIAHLGKVIESEDK